MIPQEELVEYRELHAKRKARNAYLRAWLNDPAHPERKVKDRARCRAVKEKLGKDHLAASKRRWLRDMGPDAERRSYMLANAKKRAREKGLRFAITIDDIVVPERCPVLGIPIAPFHNGTRYHKDDSASLDRIDSSRGYTPDNIVVVSWRANALKKDATLEEMEKIVAFYRPLLKK